MTAARAGGYARFVVKHWTKYLTKVLHLKEAPGLQDALLTEATSIVNDAREYRDELVSRRPQLPQV